MKYTERGNLASMAAVPLFRMLGRHCRPSLLSAYLRACRPAHLPSPRPAFLSSSELRAWTSTCLSITCLLMPSHLQKTPACQQQLALLPHSHLTIPANLSSLIPHYLNFPTMFTRLPDSRPHSQPIRLNPPEEKKKKLLDPLPTLPLTTCFLTCYLTRPPIHLLAGSPSPKNACPSASPSHILANLTPGLKETERRKWGRKRILGKRRRGGGEGRKEGRTGNEEKDRVTLGDNERFCLAIN